MIDIFPMKNKHIKDVFELVEETGVVSWSRDTLLREISHSDYLLLVAISESMIVGFCTGNIIVDELHIHSVVVKNDYRRRGIARQLLTKLLLQAYERSVTSATLEVRSVNQPAISLYESLSFRQEALRKNYYQDDGDDAIIMWLRSNGED